MYVFIHVYMYNIIVLTPRAFHNDQTHTHTHTMCGAGGGRGKRETAEAIYSVVNIIIAYGDGRTDGAREKSPSSGQSRPITGNDG